MGGIMSAVRDWILVVLLPLAVLLNACNAEKPAQPFADDPIMAIGHGTFIGRDGKEITPDESFIKRLYAYYLSSEERDTTKEQRATASKYEVNRVQEIINAAVEDRVLADALMIDWMIEHKMFENEVHVTSVNNALRWYYLLKIKKGAAVDINRDKWTKGIKPEIADKLNEQGIPSVIPLTTTLGGKAYVEECRSNGVPVPQAMFSDEWVDKGTFDKEFISEANTAELWMHSSSSPKGVCLALPRYPGGSDFAELLGIICLGTESNKACFFDNPNGKFFKRGVRVGIEEFVGGVDLVANAQGICSDCHAGENPFNVHPEKPPFVGFSALPNAWPDYLVSATWPQNPGPSTLLDAIPSTGRCDNCHRVGSAGRFPDVSTELSGYCGTVLKTAIGENDPTKRTMPPFGLDKTLYGSHIEALKTACAAPPSKGVVVDANFPDDPSVISAPIVIDPLYQCATGVAVRGGILDAKLTLFVNGVPFGPKVVRNPDKEEFSVPPLVKDDIVSATQELSGATSAASAPVTVRDHRVDFPAGLPAPTIDPKVIYQCAGVIAVRHVPGAEVTVFSDGAAPTTVATSTGWTAISPTKRPFVVGEVFTAQASLCGDPSPISTPEKAAPAPSTLPTPTFNPPAVYPDQQLTTLENLVNGSQTSVFEATAGLLGTLSTPVSWFPNYDVASALGRPLSTSDTLIASQKLCDASSGRSSTEAKKCEDLPAPRIAFPVPGQTFVSVTGAVPGARVRVYDKAGKELGDGSGTVITLNRPIAAGDVITVVQQVGKCTSKQGYQVTVRTKNGD